MIGSQAKKLKLLVILHIISTLFLFNSCSEIKEKKIDAFVISEKEANANRVVFELDNIQYDILIETSKPDSFHKFFITVKDCSEDKSDVFCFSSIVYNNEITCFSEKNGFGVSIKYNIETKDNKIYDIPLNYDQLEYEVINGEYITLPPEL